MSGSDLTLQRSSAFWLSSALQIRAITRGSSSAAVSPGGHLTSEKFHKPVHGPDHVTRPNERVETKPELTLHHLKLGREFRTKPFSRDQWRDVTVVSSSMRPSSPRPRAEDPSVGQGRDAGASAAGTPSHHGDKDLPVVSSELFPWACVRRWLPLVYREELYQVVKLTGPLLLSRILNFFMPFVVAIFCGHIGNAELAGFALASAVINVTTTATGSGLAVACDTLISQTYGSKNLKRVGVILQRSSLILLLFCLPCWGLLINCRKLLLLMHQEEQVARIAELYVMIFLPAVPAMFLHQLQVAYLQNQGILLPQMYTAAVANLINLGVNYVLIVSLDYGVLGSAIANSLSQVTICLLLFGYIRWRRVHAPTWGGWTTECLQEWGQFMKLAVPSALMICFEWWIWEIGGFLAGSLGEVDLAAQHVMAELGAITYMFPFSIHAAVCVRVGNALGAGETSRAIVTCKVALLLAGFLALLQGVCIFSSRSVLGYIFTSDHDIAALVADTLLVYTFLQLFDSLLCVCTGILVGAGMQKIAAVSNLVGYYFLALPVGVALMFAAKLRIQGLWLGLLVCVSFEASLFLALIFRLDWGKVTRKAQRRAGKDVRPLDPPGSDGPRPSAGPDPARLNKDVEDPTHTKGSHAQAEGGGGSAAPQTEAELLSVTQLVLRRGLVLLVSLLLLVLGAVLHFVTPTPEPSRHNSTNVTSTASTPVGVSLDS
ncbi:multidrug and toxin extrusion protein 1 [Neosynchiropus ocellatus]